MDLSTVNVNKVCQDFHKFMQGGPLPAQFVSSFEQLDWMLQDENIQSAMRREIGKGAFKGAFNTQAASNTT